MNPLTFLSSFVDPFLEPWRTILLGILALLVIIALYLTLYVLRTVRYLVLDKKIAKKSIPFSISQENSLLSILILGDSLAYGTGAQEPHNSIAGRLAKDLPYTSIENRAENGAHIFDVAQKALRLEKKSYDMVIVQVGGNDILSYTNPKHIRNYLKVTIHRVQKIAKKHIIVVSPMNASSSPLFWFPFNLLYGARSRMVRNIFHKETRAPNITLVDLYVPKYRDPFAQEEKKYFAQDNIHPNDDGYGVLYSKIREVTDAYHVFEKLK